MKPNFGPIVPELVRSVASHGEAYRRPAQGVDAQGWAIATGTTPRPGTAPKLPDPLSHLLPERMESEELCGGQEFQKGLLLSLEEPSLFQPKLLHPVHQRLGLLCIWIPLEEHGLHTPAKGLLFPEELGAVFLEGLDRLTQVSGLLVVEVESLTDHLAKPGANPPLELGPVLALTRHARATLTFDVGGSDAGDDQHRDRDAGPPDHSLHAAPPAVISSSNRINSSSESPSRAGAPAMSPSSLSQSSS